MNKKISVVLAIILMLLCIAATFMVTFVLQKNRYDKKEQRSRPIPEPLIPRTDRISRNGPIPLPGIQTFSKSSF